MAQTETDNHILGNPELYGDIPLAHAQYNAGILLRNCEGHTHKLLDLLNEVAKTPEINNHEFVDETYDWASANVDEDRKASVEDLCDECDCEPDERTIIIRDLTFDQVAKIKAFLETEIFPLTSDMDCSVELPLGH